MKYEIKKDFGYAPDCRTHIKLQKGVLFEVPSNKVKEWIDAGFIVDVPKTAVVETIETPTVEVPETSVVESDEPHAEIEDFDLESMSKDELEAHAQASFNLDIDKRKSIKNIIEEIRDASK